MRSPRSSKAESYSEEDLHTRGGMVADDAEWALYDEPLLLSGNRVDLGSLISHERWVDRTRGPLLDSVGKESHSAEADYLEASALRPVEALSASSDPIQE